MSIHEQMGPQDEPAPAVPDEQLVRSPHRLDTTDHSARLTRVYRDLDGAAEDLARVMADPTVRGIPRDQIQLAAVEIRRNAARVKRALEGIPLV